MLAHMFKDNSDECPYIFMDQYRGNNLKTRKLVFFVIATNTVACFCNMALALFIVPDKSLLFSVRKVHVQSNLS